MDTTHTTHNQFATENDELEYWKEINRQCVETESSLSLGAWAEADFGKYDDRL